MKTTKDFLNRALRILAIISLSLLLVIALFLIFLSLPPGENVVRGILEDQMTQALSQRVAIGRFETDIFSRIHLGGIRLLPSDPASDDPVLALKEITARYELWRLLKKEISLSSITIDSLVLDLRRDTIRGFNIDMIDSIMAAVPSEEDTIPPGIEPGFGINIHSASLSRAQVRYRDEDLPFSISLPQMSMKLIRRNGHSEFDMDIDQGLMQFMSGENYPLAMHSRGRMNSRGIHLDSARMVVGSMKIAASGLLDTTAEQAIEGRVVISGQPDVFLHLARVQSPSMPTTSLQSMDLVSTITGRMDNPVTGLRLTLSGVRVENSNIDHAHITAESKDSLVTIDSLSIQTLRGLISGRAIVKIDSPLAAKATINLRNISMGDLIEAIQEVRPPYDGRLSGTLDARADAPDLEHLVTSATLRIDEARLEGRPVPPLTVDATLDRGNGRFTLQQQDANVRGTMAIRGENIQGKIALDIRKLETFTRIIDTSRVTGRLSANGSISGTISSPDARIDVLGTGISYQNLPLDSLRIHGEFRNKKLSFEEIAFSGGLDSIDPASAPFGLDSLSGAFHYSGSVQGSIERPTGYFRAEILRPVFGQFHLDSIAAAISMDGQRIRVDRFAFVKDTLSISTVAEVNLTDSTGAMSVRVTRSVEDPVEKPVGSDGVTGQQDISLGQIDARGKYHADGGISLSAEGNRLDIGVLEKFVLDTANLGGRLGFTAEMSGSPNNPELSLIASLREPRYQKIALDSLLARLNLRNGLLDLESLDLHDSLVRLMANIEVTLSRDTAGQLTLDERSTTKGSLKVPNLNFALLQPVLSDDAVISGSASLTVNWEGTIPRPSMQGTFAIDTLFFQSDPSSKAIEQVNVRGSLRDSVVDLTSVTGLAAEVPFSISGSITASESERIGTDLVATFGDMAGAQGRLLARGFVSSDEIAFTGDVEDLDLRLFQPFTSGVDSVSGVMGSQVKVSGNPEKPIVHGFVQVRNVFLLPSTMDSAFHDGTLDASFTGTTANLDSLVFRSGQGRIFARARVVVDGGEIQDIDFATRITRLHLKMEDLGIFRIDSAGISYTSRDGRYLLSGELRLGESRVLAGLEPEQLLPWAQSVRTVEPTLPQFLMQTRLDLRVRETDSLWVDNNLAEIRLHADVGVIGSAPKPNLTGRISIKEGNLLYLDREFKVMEGAVYFLDPNKLNPEVQLKAVANVTTYQGLTPTNYTITLAAKGTLEELETELSSEPPLDRADIVTLLTLGATREELTGRGGDGASGTLVQRAGQLASGRLTGLVTSPLGSLLGLEQVSVQGNLMRMGEPGGPQLVASKAISDRAKLTYSTAVGHLNEQSIRLDYRLTPLFFLEGLTDQEGRSSISLKYSIKFR